MKILSIETSCDETAVSILEANGGLTDLSFKVHANLVLSQIKLHEKYGGVFPSLAKREHSKNLVPLIKEALQGAGLLIPRNEKSGELEESSVPLDKYGQLDVTHDVLSPEMVLNSETAERIKADLSRETELYMALMDFLDKNKKPKIDLIAVTYGPGLEPALWVGINAAKVLSEVWGIPIMPVNHMEGHISSVLLDAKSAIEFPALALLISGGHTEIVLVKDWLNYEVVGQTRDDAVGEAYDKVARMLGLSYPGGPKIAQLAEEAREKAIEIAEETREETRGGKRVDDDVLVEPVFIFPRPMIKSDNLDFSFSGLKTSVLYTIRKITDLNLEIKKSIALAFEDAVVETLVYKTDSAIKTYHPKTLIIAGGVIANKTIRSAFEGLVARFPETKLLVPGHNLSTDNALMIAMAAYVRYLKSPTESQTQAQNDIVRKNITAQGNVRL